MAPRLEGGAKAACGQVSVGSALVAPNALEVDVAMLSASRQICVDARSGEMASGPPSSSAADVSSSERWCRPRGRSRRAGRSSHQVLAGVRRLRMGVPNGDRQGAGSDATHVSQW